MDVREKLVELLDIIIQPGQKTLGDIADCLINNGVTVQEWISVKDRLPEEKGEYIVAFHPCYWDSVNENQTCVGIDTFRGKNAWAKKKFQRVTHWMEKPKPPKGE